MINQQKGTQWRYGVDKMKYNLQWLIFGFGVFWLIHLLAWASEINPNPKWFVNIIPLFCWGMFSLLKLINKKYNIITDKSSPKDKK